MRKSTTVTPVHNDNRIVLASASPRRLELLTALGLSLETAPAEVDETVREDETPRQAAVRLAMAKASVVSHARRTDRPILAADTLVVIDGRALGKPRDEQEARQMLETLRGRWHDVITGLSIVPPSGPSKQRLCTTKVLFRDLSDTEIMRYVASGDPMDKAGAYAIQNTEHCVVAGIRGCYFNVVGLPLCAVASGLEPLGFTLQAMPSIADVCHVCLAPGRRPLRSMTRSATTEGDEVGGPCGRPYRKRAVSDDHGASKPTQQRDRT